MSADDFLDTNVFVYLFDEADAGKQRQAEILINSVLLSRTGCISFQVVQETLNVLIGRLRTPVDRLRILMDDVLSPLWQVNPTAALYQDAISLQGRYGFSFYDSLIVASALEAGCTRLYSEDLQHGQQVQRLTIVNPFENQ